MEIIELTDGPSSLILQCFSKLFHKFYKGLLLSFFPSMAIHIPQLRSFHNPKSHGTFCPSFLAIKNFFQKQLTIFSQSHTIITYAQGKLHYKQTHIHISQSSSVISRWCHVKFVVECSYR